MAKLHELLAAEKTVTSARALLTAETTNKFGKEQFFSGHTKVLKMIKDGAAEKALEEAAKDIKAMPTTVPATLDYFLEQWSKAEDLLHRKNVANTQAKADIVLNGEVVASNVPVDELMGLESRLTELRKVLQLVPTLDASKRWVPRPDLGAGIWETANPEVTTKTEKEVRPVVLYEATDKHPAQVKEMSSDVIVGTFTLTKQSGAITARAKADMLLTIDNLIAEIKQARTRANEVEVPDTSVAGAIIDLIMRPVLAELAQVPATAAT